MSVRWLWCVTGALLLAACSGSNGGTPDGGSLTTAETLDVSRGGSGSGSVASAPMGIDCGDTCTASFTSGTDVTLTPTPAAGSIFTGWTGDCTGASATCTLHMDAHRSVTANFAVVTHPIDVALSGTGTGTVTSAPDGLSCTSGTCSASFPEGQSVTLTATAAGDSVFSGWSGDCASATGNTCTLSVDAAKNVGAVFTSNSAVLTVAVNGTGGGTVDSSPAGISGCSASGGTCSVGVTPGASVTLQASPDATSTVSFSGCDSTSGTSCQVSMSAPRTVTVTFTRNQVALSLTVARTGAATGKVSSSPAGISNCSTDGTGTCSAQFDQGSTVTLNASPDAVSQVAWTGCTPVGGNPNACTVSMSAAKSVTATFSQVFYTLTLDLSGTGTGSVSPSVGSISCSGSTCTGTYLKNTAVTLTETPGANSIFGGWSGAGCSGTGTTCAVTMSGNQTVTASFTHQFALTLAMSGGGASGSVASSPAGVSCSWNGSTTSGTCSGNFTSAVTLTATAPAGSNFTGWTGCPSGNGTSCSIAASSANLTVTANWAPQLAVSSVAPANNATGVSPNTAITVNFNRAVDATTVTSQAASGACSGSVQVSSDGFATCVGTTQATTDDITFTFTPSSALASSTTYKVKISSAVTDTSGNAVTAFAQSNGFTTANAFAVQSTVPANASTVASPASIAISFNRTAQGSTITTQATSGACTGSVQVSTSAGFASCLGGSLSPSGTDASSYTFTPSSAFSASTTYYLKITTAATDTTGSALLADDTASFNTAAALSVQATNPADGATEVDPNATTVTITFNNNLAGGTLSVNGGGTACTGSVQISTASSNFSSCRSLTGITVNNNVVTITAASAWNGGTTYKIRVTTAAQDIYGQSLASQYTSSTGFTGALEVSALTATPALQSAQLSWTNPSSSNYASANVYYRKTGTGTWSAPQNVASPGSSLTISGLLPDTGYDFLVTTLSTGGAESTGVTTTATTAFTGALTDFTAGQKITGLKGRDIYFTWNDTEFFAAIDKGSAAQALNTGDALWIAFDTDPSGDANGSAVLQGVACDGTNCPSWEQPTDVTWAFKADDVVEVKLTGSSPAAAVSLWSATANSWSPLASATFDVGTITEVMIPKSALGSPAQARLAFLATTPATGISFDLAPASGSATDVIGAFSGLTRGLDLGTSLWDTSKTATSASGATGFSAPALVTISVDTTGGLSGAPSIWGNIHPLTYSVGTTSYTLMQNGAVYTGTFNLGGVAKPLFFVFSDGTNAEPNFGNFKDRVYTLSGTNETVPALTWGTVYSATHTATITFEVTGTLSGGAIPTLLMGNTAPLSWTTGTALTASSPYSATVQFVNQDFVTGTTLQFKVKDSGSTWENGCGSPSGNHEMNDDVINSRTLSWAANSCPGDLGGVF